ncbi:MAG: ArsR family transcriptional regulator, partial [Hamadaea sp.]|nr:ArsR family transcriptional regulator [Hamadaea sp.]
MAIRIALGGVELARVRFGISPAYETVMALAALQRPGVHAVHLPWVRWAKPRLPQVPGLRLLLDLAGNPQAKPAFLLPPPDDRLPTLAHELRRITAVTPERVREELDLLRIGTTSVRRLADDPRRGLRDAAEALAACHRDLIAPHWTRIQRILEADIVHRAGLMAAGGFERLFADLHGEVALDGDELVVHRSRPPHRPPPVSLRGHGLVLCPSVFCWPGVTVGKRPV